jgi:hypothetical protein
MVAINSREKERDWALACVWRDEEKKCEGVKRRVVYFLL